MTYGEIIATITAYNKRNKVEAQLQASIQYKLADLIGMSVGRLLDEKTKFPPIEEAFPGLFDELIVKKDKKQNWQLMKERMTDFAEKFNNREKDIDKLSSNKEV